MHIREVSAQAYCERRNENEMLKTMSDKAVQLWDICFGGAYRTQFYPYGRG
jgi:hypothetical protein